MPLSPDDPAREKILALRASNATPEDVMDALETYEVSATYLVKGLSPGHAKLIVNDFVQHTIEVHLAPGTFAITGVQVTPDPLTWLQGPLATLDSSEFEVPDYPPED